MIRFISLFVYICLLVTTAFGAIAQQIYLSSTHQKINIVWSILPKVLHVDGRVKVENNDVAVSAETNEVILIGIPGCKECTGILSQSSDNNIFLKVYRLDERGIKVPMTFERSSLRKDAEGNLYVGKTDSLGIFVSLLPIIQIDVLYTVYELAWYEKAWKQLRSEPPKPIGKTQVILRFLTQPDEYSDRKF